MPPVSNHWVGLHYKGSPASQRAIRGNRLWTNHRIANAHARTRMYRLGTYESGESECQQHKAAHERNGCAASQPAIPVHRRLVFLIALWCSCPLVLLHVFLTQVRLPALDKMQAKLSTRTEIDMAKQPRGRVTQPMIRIDGSLQPVTWEQALDRTASGFRTTLEKHGPEAFGIFSCSKTTNELNFATQKFARCVMRSNNIDSCNRT